jgi:predicted transcriptional regulator
MRDHYDFATMKGRKNPFIKHLKQTVTLRQNLTVSLEKALIRQLKIIAAQRNTSISGMLGDELRHIVAHDSEYANARRRALATLDQGLHLGGIPAPRDELHER